MLATFYVFGQIPAVPFRDGLQHSFRQASGSAVRNRLHGVDDRDAKVGKAAFIGGRLAPITAESVHLPGNDSIEDTGFGSHDHFLKLSAQI